MPEARCPCGTARIELAGPPLLRARCHCSICQRFNQGPYADIVVYRTRDVRLHDPDSVSFSTYRPPPNVQRGLCAACGKPALEHARIPLYPRISMIPADNLPEEALPAVAMHLFYRSRVADAEDALPKHGGYLGSQIAFTLGLLRGMRSGA